MAERLRVGIDGMNLELARGTGVATYARMLGRTIAGMGGGVELLFGLPVPPSAPEALRETLFFNALGGEERDGATARAGRRGPLRWWVSPRVRRPVEVPVAGRVDAAAFAERLPPFERLWTFGSLWSVAARHFRRYGRFLELALAAPPPVMHWTYPVPIRVRGAANVYTVHDVVPLRLPHTSLEDKAQHHRLLTACAQEGARICTVSDASRADILRFTGAAPERVVNCGQAIDAAPTLSDAEVAAQLRGLFGLERHGYFLFFGAIEPKKNVGRMIEAYLRSGVDAPLVLAGGRGWRAEPELRLAERAGERIRVMDYLPRRMLDVLVAGARAVLFPSLYEGFGLPVAEAMARGVPVVCSDAGALPEVAGGAAVLVDPYDVDALVAAIRRVDGDAALRAQLSEAGRAQAPRFAPGPFGERLMTQLYAPLLRDVGTSAIDAVAGRVATA